MFHHNQPSGSRRQRLASRVAARIPSCELPASRTSNPAIGNGPHPCCRDVDPPTCPVHDARRPGVAAACCVVFRKHCRGRLHYVRCLMRIRRTSLLTHCLFKRACFFSILRRFPTEYLSRTFLLAPQSPLREGDPSRCRVSRSHSTRIFPSRHPFLANNGSLLQKTN